MPEIESSTGIEATPLGPPNTMKRTPLLVWLLGAVVVVYLAGWAHRAFERGSISLGVVVMATIPVAISAMWHMTRRRRG